MGMLGLCCSVNSLKVDEAEKGIDVIFLHFFVLEFVLRVIALGGVDMSWTAFFCQVEIGLTNSQLSRNWVPADQREAIWFQRFSFSCSPPQPGKMLPNLM